jgi:hypothetical protein
MDNGAWLHCPFFCEPLASGQRAIEVTPLPAGRWAEMEIAGGVFSIFTSELNFSNFNHAKDIHQELWPDSLH